MKKISGISNKQRILATSVKSDTPNLKAIFITNVFQRIVFSVLMLGSFIFICQSNKIYQFMLLLILTGGMCYEIILMAKNSNSHPPLDTPLVFYTSFIIFIDRSISTICKIYPLLDCYCTRNHSQIFFIAYLPAFIFIVIRLKKEILASQMTLLAILHIASFVFGSMFSMAISNVCFGSFYLFYPSLLVISNDIFAYIVGKSIGKTPLYSLSPKKTYEGFFGAAFFTFLTGTIICYLKINFDFLPDTVDIVMRAPISEKIPFLDIPMLYVHNIIFSIFASFIAPFLGFFASALKRVFNKKDFGNIIPGHGGITDRMDCQVLMCIFTYIYLKKLMASPLSEVYDNAITHLNQDELKRLAYILYSRVNPN
jgi:phosphatidate cytidylyltransferase